MDAVCFGRAGLKKTPTSAERNLCLLLRHPLAIFFYEVEEIWFNSTPRYCTLVTKTIPFIVSPVFENPLLKDELSISILGLNVSCDCKYDQARSCGKQAQDSLKETGGHW